LTARPARVAVQADRKSLDSRSSSWPQGAGSLVGLEAILGRSERILCHLF